MIGIISSNNDAAFNLATEEYLLKNRSEDIFFLYTDSPSIIVGKHQNTYAEINYKEVLNQNISVYRRLSGGGTVYHDSGNLNFCFISNGNNSQFIDFKIFTKQIVDVLQNIGIRATLGGRNDIILDGKKISGNASHVYKNRLIHHGTLLFNSNLKSLGNSLKTDPIKYQDKAVKSVRSIVTNISEHIETPITFEQFKDLIFKAIIPNNSNKIVLSSDEINKIESLASEKYKTWDWNFGYSPDYTFKKRIRTLNSIYLIQFSVSKGIIKTIQYSEEGRKIEFEKLINIQHKPESIAKVLESFTELNGVNGDIILQFF
jgi:lipoate-protein ligase A